MSRSKALIPVCFCAGMLGALISSLVAWKSGEWGLPGLLSVRLRPSMSLPWLYSQLIWGGLWGLAYFLLVGGIKSRRHWVRKGLLVSLLPSLFQLFYVFPQLRGQDWLGLSLGQFTPLFVLLYNLIWGFFTGIFCRLLWGRS